MTTYSDLKSTLTPADFGILSATLDDCRADGLGDDDTMTTLENIALLNDMCETEDEAAAIAYGFYSSQF